MNVAIIGGTRFIGPYIVKHLLEQGHQVQVYHRNKTPLEQMEGVQHITIDRMEPGQTTAALKKHQPRAIIDMIAFRREHIQQVLDANLNLEHYVFCGSTSVYGRIGESTPSETTPVNPTSEYESGKVDCEQCLLMAQDQMPMTILRLAHPQGPGDHLLYVTGRESQFIDRIRQGRPVVIPNDGLTRTHPIYVEDAARSFVHVLGRNDCLGKIYNLGGEEIFTWNEYLAVIAKVLGQPLVAKHIPADWIEAQRHLWADEPRKFDFASILTKYPSSFDVSALQATGFKCLTNHEQAAAATIAWLDEEGLIPPSSDNDLEDILIRQAQQTGVI